jgi:CheY-like chemotaxis protein
MIRQVADGDRRSKPPVRSGPISSCSTNLPGVDGYSVCRRSRATPGWPRPGAFITTRSSLDDRAVGLTLGADDTGEARTCRTDAAHPGAAHPACLGEAEEEP